MYGITATGVGITAATCGPPDTGRPSASAITGCRATGSRMARTTAGSEAIGPNAMDGSGASPGAPDVASPLPLPLPLPSPSPLAVLQPKLRACAQLSAHQLSQETCR